MKLQNIKIKKIVDPILIYQMGKVGSTSVYNSLKCAGISNSLFHVHQLSDEGIKRKEMWLKHHEALEIPWVKEDLQYIKKIKELITRNRSEFQWKIITMTRDPVSVKLSAFFENIEVYGNTVFDSPDKVNIAKTIDCIRKEAFDLEKINGDYYHVWFDEELKTVFDIDVYQVPYDFNKGYTIITKEEVSVLVMRIEDMSESFQDAMAEFLKIDKIKLIKDNTADNKKYWHEYQTVLKNFKLPLEFLDLIYATPYARHFYRNDKNRKSWEKWLDKTGLRN
ncbi:MAG: putative capsular polysaccharide synthesis family protein [Acidobacteria bacterium]|jgi:hypothetical protein|nr:putative capsular polysaccharide synthesis family protein [Acidobacteriota bacterium]